MQVRGSQPENLAEKRGCSLLDRFVSGQSQRLASRSNLFRENETAQHVFMLREGQVELSISAGNRRLFRKIAHPGFLLGVAAALTNRPHPYTATAADSVLASSLTAQEFREFLKENPEACFEVAQSVGGELMEMFESGVRPMRNKPRHLKPQI